MSPRAPGRVWTGAALILLCLAAAPLGGQEAERSAVTVWRDVLRYGTDTEVLSAVGAMRDAREQALVTDLAGLVAQSRSEQVRVAVLGYLELLGDPAALEPALKILAQREASPAVLRAAMTYLGVLHAKGAWVDLLALAESADVNVAAGAVTALGRVEAGEAAEPLRELYGKEETPAAVRLQIILALGDLKHAPSREFLEGIAADRAADRVSRMYAATSLGKIGDTESVRTLTAMLSETDALVRARAAAALGRLRAPGVAETLLQVLRDSSYQVRLEAATAIADGAAEGSITDELVGMLVYRARRDEVTQVRLQVIRALGGIPRPECRELLRELYEAAGQPIEIRAAALTELLRTDLEGNLDVMRRVVESEWTARSQRALELTAARLSERSSGALDDLLGRFLESANIAVKISGIRGIARNGLTRYAEGLRRAAAQANVSIRREALAALEKLGLAREQPPDGPSGAGGLSSPSPTAP